MIARASEHVFLSAEPEVAIENIFDRPFDNAIATARTCYSSRGIISTRQVAGEDVLVPIVVIGLVAAFMTLVGMLLARRIGPRLGRAGEVLAGLVLIGIGVKVLADAIFF